MERNTKHQTPSSREVPESKHQKPNSKHQRNPKFHAPNRGPRFELGAWSFSGVWSLVFGTWCFFGAWSLEFGTCCVGSQLLKNCDPLSQQVKGEPCVTCFLSASMVVYLRFNCR